MLPIVRGNLPRAPPKPVGMFLLSAMRFLPNFLMARSGTRSFRSPVRIRFVGIGSGAVGERNVASGFHHPNSCRPAGSGPRFAR